MQIDFSEKVIHVLDPISIQDFNIIAFKHKLGDFNIAGILFDEEGIDLIDDLELGPHTSVAGWYNDKES